MNAPKTNENIENKRVGSLVASPYLKRAENMVRMYLRYDDADDVAKFRDTISSIAYNLSKEQELMDKALESYDYSIEPVSSESYSEGPVTISKSYEGASIQSKISSISKSFKTLNDLELEKLVNYRKVLVIKRKRS